MELTPNARDTIARQILGFPCFSDARSVDHGPDGLISVVSEAYEDDNLTEEQDLAFEAVLYLSGLTEDFDLIRAVGLWQDEDYAVFRRLLDETRPVRGATAS